MTTPSKLFAFLAAPDAAERILQDSPASWVAMLDASGQRLRWPAEPSSDGLPGEDTVPALETWDLGWVDPFDFPELASITFWLERLSELASVMRPHEHEATAYARVIAPGVCRELVRRWQQSEPLHALPQIAHLQHLFSLADTHELAPFPSDELRLFRLYFDTKILEARTDPGWADGKGFEGLGADARWALVPDEGEVFDELMHARVVVADGRATLVDLATSWRPGREAETLTERLRGSWEHDLRSLPFEERGPAFQARIAYLLRVVRTGIEWVTASATQDRALVFVVELGTRYEVSAV